MLAVGVLVGAEVRAATGGSLSDWPVLRSYAGEHLRRIKMPLGGIGTGTISLSGTGGLVDWEIRGAPDKGFTPTGGEFFYVSPFFAVRTETPEGDVAARILEGPVDTEHYEGQSGSGVRNHGFARWRECTFKVAYPLARAEQVVRDIRSRYDGRKRNPFDEAECGHHYARALAAWTVLEAFQVKQED